MSRKCSHFDFGILTEREKEARNKMGETLTFAQITEIKMLHLENSIRLLYKIRRDMQPFFSFYEHQVKRTDLCVNHRAGAERARGDQGVPVTYKGWSTGCWAAEGNLESNKQHVTRGS